jgi:hypothetical protein
MERTPKSLTQYKPEMQLNPTLLALGTNNHSKQRKRDYHWTLGPRNRRCAWCGSRRPRRCGTPPRISCLRERREAQPIRNPLQYQTAGNRSESGGAEGRGLLTELEAGGGLRGVGNGVAGNPPWAAPRVLRGERPRAHGDVDPLHLRAPRVGEAPGRTGAAVGSGVSWPSGAWGFLGVGFDFSFPAW